MRKLLFGMLVAIAVIGAITSSALSAGAASPPRGLISPPSGDTATIDVSPPSGPAGTVVTISNNNSCFGGNATATVNLQDPANQTATESGLDGSWSVQITVAPGTPPGIYQVTATCSGADEQPSAYSYTSNQFIVTGSTPSPTPSSSPPTPSPTSPAPSPSPTATATAPPATAVSGQANFTG